VTIKEEKRDGDVYHGHSVALWKLTSSTRLNNWATAVAVIAKHHFNKQRSSDSLDWFVSGSNFNSLHWFKLSVRFLVVKKTSAIAMALRRLQEKIIIHIIKLISFGVCYKYC
jgi:hypothetical protein